MNKEYELKVKDEFVSLFCESCGFSSAATPVIETFQESWPEQKKKLLKEMESHKCILSEEQEQNLKRVTLKKKKMVDSFNKSLKQFLKEEEIKDVQILLENVNKDENNYLKDVEIVVNFDMQVVV